MKESCPYCGEMTSMQFELLSGTWKSKKCEYCNKDLAALSKKVPELIDEKPDLKAKAEDLPK